MLTSPVRRGGPRQAVRAIEDSEGCRIRMETPRGITAIPTVHCGGRNIHDCQPPDASYRVVLSLITAIDPEETSSRRSRPRRCAPQTIPSRAFQAEISRASFQAEIRWASFQAEISLVSFLAEIRRASFQAEISRVSHPEETMLAQFATTSLKPISRRVAILPKARGSCHPVDRQPKTPHLIPSQRMRIFWGRGESWRGRTVALGQRKDHRQAPRSQADATIPIWTCPAGASRNSETPASRTPILTSPVPPSSLCQRQPVKRLPRVT